MFLEKSLLEEKGLLENILIIIQLQMKALLQKTLMNLNKIKCHFAYIKQVIQDAGVKMVH